METKFIMHLDNQIVEPYHEFTVSTDSDNTSDILYASHDYVEAYVNDQLREVIDAINPTQFDMQWSRNLIMWEMDAYITHKNQFGYDEELHHLFSVALVNHIDIITYSESFEFLYNNNREFKNLYDAYVRHKHRDGDDNKYPIFDFDTKKALEIYLKNTT